MNQVVGWRWKWGAADFWKMTDDPALVPKSAPIKEALYAALSDSSTVSDEDWRRALDCAHSCLPPGKVTREELDNAMQHAFGMLSLSLSSTG